MTQWLDDIPVAGALSDDALAAKLGEEVAPQPPAVAQLYESTGKLSFSWLFGTPAWRHTSHIFGFIPQDGAADGSNGTAIQSLKTAKADPSLKGTRLRISLNGLRVADYPGGGIHRVLFNFFTQNRTKHGVDDVNFNATYRIAEGEHAAVLNYPIFIGVAPPETGLVIRCFTVNVKNDNDERFLDLLESDTFKLGLHLVETAQPALAPLSSLAVGMTRAIAERHRNVAVQDVYLGLDYGGLVTGARLAPGSYVAVQAPAAFLRSWHWTDWSYNPDTGQIVNQAGELMPLNYFILGITTLP